MKNEMKEMEENIVELIHDEDYDGAASPAVTAVVASITAVTALFGVTTACTRSCWHPGR